jgi:NAD+ synthase (glutamine-hydrolysing)
VRPGDEFFNLYNHDFVRVAVGVPRVRVADPDFNAANTISLIEEAASRHAVLTLFPELGLSAYTCDDLFHQQALLDSCLRALERIRDKSRSWPLLSVVGLPLRIDHLLYNCAAVIGSGKILGVIPKTYLPTYREFYEMRYFAPAPTSMRAEIELLGQRGIPFGNRLLFQIEDQPLLTFHVEICEDLWVPIPPSSYAALAGATVLLNLSASNTTVAKADYRRQLVSGQSARCLAAYMYSAAGPGESTTDLAWDGQGLISENGRILAESERFRYEPQLIGSEIDLEYIAQERMRQTSFGQCVMHESSNTEGFRRIPWFTRFRCRDSSNGFSQPESSAS